MGVGVLRARVDDEGIAAQGARVGDEPVEEAIAMAEGAAGGVGDEILDVEHLAGVEYFLDAGAGDGAPGAGGDLEQREPVAVGRHAPDARKRDRAVGGDGRGEIADEGECGPGAGGESGAEISAVRQIWLSAG